MPTIETTGLRRGRRSSGGACGAAMAAIAALAAASTVASGADWPMWRCDAARSAATSEQLAGELHAQWTWRFSPRVPVWDDRLNRDLMRYDSVFEPVAAGGRVFVPFNDSDKLVCLDADTGRELWRFYVDGPVRLPPVAAADAVYVASDDGCLWCIDASSGRVRWRHRGAPTGRKALGNRRIISTWPARGGPALDGSRIYYAASIWPFMGTFVYALDAATGAVVWCNESTDAQYVKQPHDSPAFAGVAPQGALAVAAGRLLVPGGRSVPACFDAATGGHLYYQLAANGKTGGSFVCAAEGMFFNHHRDRLVSAYDLATGAGVAGRIGEYPAVRGTTAYFSGERIVALDLVSLRRAPEEPKNARLWDLACDASGDLILAGERLYAGGANGITAVDLPRGDGAGTIAWCIPAASRVARLLAADGRLFAVGVDGSITAYGARRATAATYEDAAAPKRSVSARARAIVAASGVSAGWALVCGSAAAKVAESLADASDLCVVALVADERGRDSARRALDARKLYGGRVAVYASDAEGFEAPPYVFSLVLVLESAPARAIATLYRSVRPYDGVLWCEKGAAEELRRATARGELAGAKAIDAPDAAAVRRCGPLAGAASWTHQYGDAANTVKSDDDLVKLPLGVLWFGGVSHDNVLPRHGHGPPEQVVGGRLFIHEMDGLGARDVYTGRVLWTRHPEGLDARGTFYDETYRDAPTDTSYNQVHLPGANARGTDFVAGVDRVYVVAGTRCNVLDAAEGTPLAQFDAPPHAGSARDGWGFIAVEGETLLGGSGFIAFSPKLRTLVEKLQFAAAFDTWASRTLFAMDRLSGKLLWRADAVNGFAHNGIVASGGRVWSLDTMPPYLAAKLGKDAFRDGAASIVAREARTGRVLWRVDDDVFGAWLGYSAEHDILLLSGRPSRDMIAGEDVNRMAAYRGSDGRLVWNSRQEYGSPPMLHGARIITEGAMFELLTGRRVELPDPLTGQPVAWQFKRTFGCSYAIAGEHILTFRSAAAGFYDLAGDGGTGNLGGFKSGCTSNLIAADGVLNAPDYTRTCSCAYQNQTSLALVHDPDNEFWTTYDRPAPAGPIQRIGVNLGAPGDRRDAAGTMWLEYPVVGGASPEGFAEVAMPAGTYYRLHSARLAPGGVRWVTASGLAGEATIRIPLGVAALRTCTVRLHFAEPDESFAAGARVFDVLLQGAVVLRSFDVAREAGGPRRAVVKEFRGVAATADVTVELRAAGGRHPPVLGGIEVVVDR